MKKLMLMTAALSLVSLSAFADDNFSLKIQVKSTDSFTIQGMKAIGTESAGKMNISISGSQDGQSINFSTGDQDFSTDNNTIMEIKDGSVRVTDREKPLDITLGAKMVRNRTGGLTSFTIAAQDIEAILKEALIEQGDAAITSLHLDAEGTKLDYDVNLGDYTCGALNSILKCDVVMNLTISGSSKSNSAPVASSSSNAKSDAASNLKK